MTLSGLVARAKRKGVRVLKNGDSYTLVDAYTLAVIGTAEGLIQLEDRINWVDSL